MLTLEGRLDICEAVWPGTRAAGALACSKALVALDEVERGRVPSWISGDEVEALRAALLEHFAKEIR